jgi:hypothetical protein
MSANGKVRTMRHEERKSEWTGFSIKDFKVCDLCGALNRVTNNQCYVCGWNGKFHKEEEIVTDAMREAVERYGSLSEAVLAGELLPDAPSERGFLTNLIDKVKQFLNGR